MGPQRYVDRLEWKHEEATMNRDESQTFDGHPRWRATAMSYLDGFVHGCVMGIGTSKEAAEHALRMNVEQRMSEMRIFEEKDREVPDAVEDLINRVSLLEETIRRLVADDEC